MTVSVWQVADPSKINILHLQLDTSFSQAQTSVLKKKRLQSSALIWFLFICFLAWSLLSLSVRGDKLSEEERKKVGARARGRKINEMCSVWERTLIILMLEAKPTPCIIGTVLTETHNFIISQLRYMTTYNSLLCHKKWCLTIQSTKPTTNSYFHY